MFRGGSCCGGRCGGHGGDGHCSCSAPMGCCHCCGRQRRALSGRFVEHPRAAARAAATAEAEAKASKAKGTAVTQWPCKPLQLQRTPAPCMREHCHCCGRCERQRCVRCVCYAQCVCCVLAICVCVLCMCAMCVLCVCAAWIVCMCVLCVCAVCVPCVCCV